MIEREPVLGLIAGTNIMREAPFVAAVETAVHTPYGEVRLQHAGPLVLVLRHGLEGNTPPHRIPHRAHVTALRRIGVRGVVSFCSVGSLRTDLRPGAFVVPADFGQLSAPPTFFSDRAVHVTPTLSEPLRTRLLRLAREEGLAPHDGGVYWQTKGPRLETAAEVRLLSTFGDIVGMTFADEATLCVEANLPVAALCSVDNMAHGLPGGEDLTSADILSRKDDTARRWAAIATRLAKGLDRAFGEAG
jgi:5'-methylthioadenosine phosphorylase